MTDDVVKLYKGIDTTLEKVKPGQPFQLIGKNTAFTKFSVLKSTTPDNWCKDNLNLRFFSVKERIQLLSGYSVPKETKVRILTGRKGHDMENKVNEHVAQNIGKMIDHVHMTMGADPEIFIEKDNEVVPAWSIFPDKKKAAVENPYWDGFQAEFTTRNGTCLAYVCDYIQNGLYNTWKSLKRGQVLSTKTVVDVPIEMLEKAKPEHVEFGCMPSHNVYNLSGIKENGRDVPYRFAGGHIHMGVDPGFRSKERIEGAVRALDAFLAVSCVSLFEGFDNPIRRQFYGLAGEYRTPAHGLEYRTLSNAWMVHPAIFHVVFETARSAARIGFNYPDLYFWPVKQDETIRIIQQNDIDGARRVLTDNKDKWMVLMKTLPYFDHYAASVHSVMLKGINKLIKEPANFKKNWLFDKWVGHSEVENGHSFRAFPSWDAGKLI